MTAHRLRLNASPAQLARLGPEEFLWRPRGEASSFGSNLGPRLEQIGDVPAPHVDLVRLAVLAFLADRSSPRGQGPGVRWDRDLALTVPVSEPDAWNSRADDLAELLHLLSGDRWTLRFESQRQPRRGRTAEHAPAPVVCLFSGGADSLAGALAARAAHGTPPVLVSHWDAPAISGIQQQMVGELARLWGQKPDHQRFGVARRTHQVGSGTPFADEKSRRTRSLLFIALGLAVAVVRDAELWMSENGFTTINPPLSPERRGSLTTRTTHPGFLDGLTRVLGELGLTVRLRNPLEAKTKGEVLTEAASSLSRRQAQRLFSLTHSCGKTPWFRGFTQAAQCGLCFGCLIRRGSFSASGLADGTEYVEQALRGQARRDDFVTPTRRKTLDAVRYRLGRGYAMSDLLGLRLPARVDLAEALDLVNRGLEELRPVAEEIP